MYKPFSSVGIGQVFLRIEDITDIEYMKIPTVNNSSGTGKHNAVRIKGQINTRLKTLRPNSLVHVVQP